MIPCGNNTAMSVEALLRLESLDYLNFLSNDKESLANEIESIINEQDFKGMRNSGNTYVRIEGAIVKSFERCIEKAISLRTASASTNIAILEKIHMESLLESLLDMVESFPEVLASKTQSIQLLNALPALDRRLERYCDGLTRKVSNEIQRLILMKEANLIKPSGGATSTQTFHGPVGTVNSGSIYGDVSGTAVSITNQSVNSGLQALAEIEEAARQDEQLHTNRSQVEELLTALKAELEKKSAKPSVHVFNAVMERLEKVLSVSKKALEVFERCKPFVVEAIDSIAKQLD